MKIAINNYYKVIYLSMKTIYLKNKIVKISWIRKVNKNKNIIKLTIQEINKFKNYCNKENRNLKKIIFKNAFKFLEMFFN